MSINMLNDDTIVAIATAMSNAGIGIIRISGENSFEIIEKIFERKNGKKLNVDEIDSHTVHYGFIKDNDKIIDEVLVLIMKAPNTYTRENVVEIDCHGGMYVMKKVLETVVKEGARPAEPGEFTKRAFLNGRIDLSKAEAVIDVIQSQNDFALESSMGQLKGTVLKKVTNLRERIIHHIAFIEAALDDPEHMSVDGYGEELLVEVQSIKKECEQLLENADDGRIRAEGIATVILGKPNAGKSSILNMMVGEERAIVTDIAGTTRDVLEEHINLGGISLNIMDTAGIRETSDVVEKIGVERAKEYGKTADLVLYVVDSSVPLDENDNEIIEFIRDKKAIVLYNKIDVKPEITKEQLQEMTGKKVIAMSAKEQTGLEELKQELKDMYYAGDVSFNDEVYITNVRQKNMIQEAYDSLNMVEQSIEDEMPEDFFTIDLMNAYEKLGMVIGESVEDDLVEQIFAKFCMGK